MQDTGFLLKLYFPDFVGSWKISNGKTMNTIKGMRQEVSTSRAGCGSG